MAESIEKRIFPQQRPLGEALRDFWTEVLENASEGRVELAELVEELQNIRETPAVLPPDMPGIDRLMAMTGKPDETMKYAPALNRVLSDAAHLIHWYPNNVYEDLESASKMDNYCANITGVEGEFQNGPYLLHSDRVIVGLFLLGPGRFYPAHRHAAPEMWYIISGSGKWKRDGEDWRIRKPGEYFIHSPWQSHSMQSLDEPIYALWAWTGDLEKWAEWTE